MGKHRVTANNQFISEKLNYVHAVIYAFQLEKYGNDNVRVVPA